MSLYHLGGDKSGVEDVSLDTLNQFGNARRNLLKGLGATLVLTALPISLFAEGRNLEDYLLTQNEMNKYGIRLADNNGEPNPYEVPDYIVQRLSQIEPGFKGATKIVAAWYQTQDESALKKVDIVFNLNEFLLNVDIKDLVSKRAKIGDQNVPTYTLTEKAKIIDIVVSNCKSQRKAIKALELLSTYFKNRGIQEFVDERNNEIKIEDFNRKLREIKTSPRSLSIKEREILKFAEAKL
ncbi:MAG: hypothetical protein KKB31_04825, partial [Nanoarchaeota archaeon]|nr:hypothetical protein [Nanoarchaeota archaeon]